MCYTKSVDSKRFKQIEAIEPDAGSTVQNNDRHAGESLDY
jgi:hypothetical protein